MIGVWPGKPTVVIVAVIAAGAFLGVNNTLVSVDAYMRGEGRGADGDDETVLPGTSYGSFCSFTDPDGNLWFVQEVTTRHPGRSSRPTRLRVCD